jgi:hypothetical protein
VQARKAKWLIDNPAEIANIFGISLERVAKLNVLPLIVTNQGAGFSLDANGCRVVDFHFLNLYLSRHEYVAGMAVKRADQSVAQNIQTLYNTEEEAIEKFASTMRSTAAETIR